ncbi:MAG: hypothetical protein B7Z80_01680 [Rhodospirillales bacterium 20-64-7]|nr:MAG: hypothetical protein B7Z80_01680 [Rhodospirillales bacterium 20-64-7]
MEPIAAGSTNRQRSVLPVPARHRPGRLFTWLIATVLALIVAAGGVIGAHADSDDDENAIQEPSRVTVRGGIVEVTLDAKAENNIGLVTAHPSPQPALKLVEAYGSVLDSAPLAALASEYSIATAQLRSAKAKLSVSKASYDRAKALYGLHQSSDAQLQAAQGTFEIDQAATAAAEASISKIITAAEQGWGSVLATGIEDNSDLVKSISGRRTFLVKAAFPPNSAPSTPPQRTVATSAGDMEATLKYISLATSSDPQIQGLTYLYSTKASPAIVPGLNLIVAAQVPTVSTDTTSVPSAAVVWLAGQAFVYVQTASHIFTQHEVSVSSTPRPGQYLVRGLSTGMNIVVIGAQMLLSEQFRAQNAHSGD